MTDNPILDILISMILIYILLSILVSILSEWLAHMSNSRSIVLRDSILKLLKDPVNLDYGLLFYNHLSIESVSKLKPYPWYNLFRILGGKLPDRKIPPQYISSGMFADVLVDIISDQARHTQRIAPQTDSEGNLILDEHGRKTYIPLSGTVPADTASRFTNALQWMKASPFRDLLQGFHDQAAGDMTKLKSLIETWYNDYQQRVSGWYKTQQRGKLIFLGFVVALMLNVDSLHLVKTLSLDSKLRAQLVATATKVADNYDKMNDSLRQSISGQIQAFRNDAANAALNQQIKTELDSTTIVNRPALLTDWLAKKYPGQFKQFRDAVTKEDSISQTLLKQTDEVLGIAASLNLPIGYSESTAPFSWFCHYSMSTSKAVKQGESQGLFIYNNQRNKGDFWYYLKYVIGICITAFSLSFGAPFWFDLLIKFVNIRRAGIKPADDSTTKK